MEVDRDSNKNDFKTRNLTPSVRNLYEHSLHTEQCGGNDPIEIIDGRLPSRARLSFGPLTIKKRIDYRDVAHFIRHYNPPEMAFYLDTNFFTGEEKPFELWEAMLERSIVITPLVWQELQPWLETPFRNRRMRDRLLDARLNRSTVRFSERADRHPFHVLALSYYVNLLGVRKRMGRLLADDFEVRNGRRASDQELKQLIRSVGAEHDFWLMFKGSTDIEKPNLFADEELVATAVIDAIVTGHECTIVTTDTDVQEQFVKMMKLLNWQYQGMLFAEKFASRPSEFATAPLTRTTPELKRYFIDDQGMLVRKPRKEILEFVEWLLPEQFKLNPVYCLLFGGNGTELKFSPLDFNAEHDMKRLLDMKGRSGGLNTDLLDGRNCHVTGFPIGVSEPRQHVVIARDDRTDIGLLQIPSLDIAHANFERGERLR